MGSLRLYCALCALCTLGVVTVVAAACGAGKGRPVEVGDAAPPFALETLRGPTLRFPEGVAGRGIVVRFWAVTCSACERELKEIEPVAERLAASGVAFVAVNVGQDRASVEKLAARLELRYPVLLDEPAATARTWGVKSLPTTFFVGSDGRVRRKTVGESDAATLERFGQELAPRRAHP